MIEDVLGEGSVSASRFSRWFSNPSRSGSRSSSLRSTPHEELERLAGKTIEQCMVSFFCIPSYLFNENDRYSFRIVRLPWFKHLMFFWTFLM